MSDIKVVSQVTITLLDDDNLNFQADGGNLTIWMGMLARAGHLIINPPKKDAPKIIQASVIPVSGRVQ